MNYFLKTRVIINIGIFNIEKEFWWYSFEKFVSTLSCGSKSLTNRLASKCLITIREDDFWPMVVVAHTALVWWKENDRRRDVLAREHSVFRCAVAHCRQFLDRANARSRSRNARVSKIHRNTLPMKWRWTCQTQLDVDGNPTVFAPIPKILYSIIIFQIVEFIAISKHMYMGGALVVLIWYIKCN